MHGGYVSKNVVSAWIGWDVQLMFMNTWPICLDQPSAKYKKRPVQTTTYLLFSQQKQAPLHVPMWTHLWLTHFMILDGPGCFLVAPSAISFSHSLCLYCIACRCYWENAGVCLRVWPNIGLEVTCTLHIPACLESFDYDVIYTRTTFPLQFKHHQKVYKSIFKNISIVYRVLLQPDSKKCHMILT